MFCVFSVKKITIFYLLCPAAVIKYMALKNEIMNPGGYRNV